MQPRIENLMLIDDDETDQMIYKRIVDRSGVVGNLIQMNAADIALEYLRSAECPPIDAIILDLRMPRMDGFEFLNALESESVMNKVQVVIVMLTTSLDPQDEARAKSHPLVADFWHKPLEAGNIVELCKLLDAVNGPTAS